MRRWLDAAGFNPPPDLRFATRRRIAHWLALAKSGSLAAIEAEIAGSRTYPGYTDVRDILTAALVVHARYQDAVALLPPRSEPWKRLIWLEWALVDLVSAGAVTEALSLLQSTRSDTVDVGKGQHLLGALAAMLQRVPAAFGDKKEFVAVLAAQVHALYETQQASVLQPARPERRPRALTTRAVSPSGARNLTCAILRSNSWRSWSPGLRSARRIPERPEFMVGRDRCSSPLTWPSKAAPPRPTRCAISCCRRSRRKLRQQDKRTRGTIRTRPTPRRHSLITSRSLTRQRASHSAWVAVTSRRPRQSP